MSADDVVIVGSGPGGAWLARDLARAGARVRVLEKGRDAVPSGRILPMWWRRETLRIAPGVTLLRALRAGGTSTMFFLTAVDPPLELFRRYGLDLERALAEVKAEVPTATLADELVGPFARRLAEVARSRGEPWTALPKMLYQERCTDGFCPSEARWSARGLLDEARALGAEVETGAEVARVLRNDARATGVEYRRGGAAQRVTADSVILAAGGIATPMILRRSGMPDVGERFICDPLTAVMGSVSGIEGGDELPMAGGLIDAQAGYMLSDMTIPGNFYRLFALQAGRPDRLLAHRRTLTVMVKVRDEPGGRIGDDGRPWRTFGELERGRMAAGVARARALLGEAGAARVFEAPWTAAHPGATVRLGEAVGADLETRWRGLYVCDASVLPGAWGLPPTLTLLVLARQLARNIVG
ncbi:FAD-dependent oxidoreductase [Acidihalobacter prosperus]